MRRLIESSNLASKTSSNVHLSHQARINHSSISKSHHSYCPLFQNELPGYIVSKFRNQQGWDSPPTKLNPLELWLQPESLISPLRLLLLPRSRWSRFVNSKAPWIYLLMTSKSLLKPIKCWDTIPLPGAYQDNFFPFPCTLWWNNSNPWLLRNEYPTCWGFPNCFWYSKCQILRRDTIWAPSELIAGPWARQPSIKRCKWPWYSNTIRNRRDDVTSVMEWIYQNVTRRGYDVHYRSLHQPHFIIQSAGHAFFFLPIFSNLGLRNEI